MKISKRFALLWFIWRKQLFDCWMGFTCL